MIYDVVRNYFTAVERCYGNSRFILHHMVTRQRVSLHKSRYKELNRESVLAHI